MPSDSMLYMGNHSTAQVKGKGKIDLVFTSGNTLTFKNVLHVSYVRGKFVGKGYHTGGMFKLNIKDVVNSSVNDVNMTEISDANDASAEPDEATTTIPIPSKVQDNDKGIMVKEPLKMKKKDQISFDKQEARRLQAKFEKEQRLEQRLAEEEAQKAL
nr:hypothetical protein [Tanacetum cinerariifolium]